MEFPILAIDYGEKHIGLAISDQKGLIAKPLDVLHVTKNRNIEILIDEIADIAKEYEVKSLLIGMPQAFIEKHKEQQDNISSFIESLLQKVSLPYETIDESFSTVDAQNMLLSMGHHNKKTKDRIDSVAAATFLQQFLTSKQE